MLKEIIVTSVSVALGMILATIVMKKFLKTSSWEEWEEEYEED